MGLLGLLIIISYMMAYSILLTLELIIYCYSSWRY